MSQENRFGEYISNLRIAKGISLEQLCDGLCDLSLLSRFERGEREPEKLLQNRFLTRLGVVPENYENFLYYKEYCRWEKRQGIVHNILDENIKEAKLLLEEYRKEYDMNDSLEQQFYLAMLVQIKRYEGSKEEELAKIFEEALWLTVPDIDTRSFRNRVLSLEELNLLLEYRYCSRRGVSLQFYEALLEYIEKMEQTMLAMAKIYPKTVYYYYMAWKASGESKETRAIRMMELCDKAIELLRNANRMFYLWELFGMKEELTKMLIDGSYKPCEYAASAEECIGWREILEELYLEYGVSIAMYEFCYLYVESENYCIGDVIRIRRKMLGLSQEKLSEGICDSRTVSRLERHIRKPQKEIVQKLFDRLNLSTELCRTELVTDSQEAIEKYRELRRLYHTKEYMKVQDVLGEMSKLLSNQYASNQQLILRKKTNTQFGLKEITEEEYALLMKKALEYTIPYKKAVASGIKYLTNEELYCIQNIAVKAKKMHSMIQECIKTLINYCEELKYPENYLRMYQFLIATVASNLGNRGKYELSNEYGRKIIKLLLVNRRLGGIHEAHYDLLWNYKKQCDVCGKNPEIERIKNDANRCVKLSILAKNENKRKRYEMKLDEYYLESGNGLHPDSR